MKKIYILIISILFTAVAWSQKVWVGPADGGNWTTANNWSGNSAPGNNDVVVFGVGVSGTITNVPNRDISGLIISDGANITLSKTGGGDNTLTIRNTNAANEFVITEGSTLTLGNNVNIELDNGSSSFNRTRASIAGTFNVNGNEYDTEGNNVTTTVEATGVISVGGGGSVSSNSSTKLVFADNAVYDHGRDGGTIPTAAWNAASLCNITGVDEDAPGGMNQTFGNFTWNCVNQDEHVSLASFGMSVAGTLSVVSTGGNNRLQMSQATLNVGGFNLSGGIFRISSGTDRILNVNGDVTISGGQLLMTSDDEAEMNVRGNFTFTGGTITESSNEDCLIDFDGSGVQVFTKSGAATIQNTIDFRISSGATVNFGTSELNGSTGDFTLVSGGKIITAHAQGLRSSGSAGSIQVSGSRSYSSNADYEFQGATTGNFSTFGNQVRDLIINNTTTNEVITNRNFLVNRFLVLTNGYVTPSGGYLRINEDGDASTTNGAFVNGLLGKVTESNSSLFMFPVGKVDGGLRMIGIQRTSAGGDATFEAEFFRASPPSAPLANGLARISDCEYWDLSKASGSSSSAAVYVTLSWASNSNCTVASPYVTDPTTLRVAHLRSNQWRNEGRQSSTGNNIAGTIRSQQAVSTFSPFALASSSLTENPLPVVFGDVRAYEKNNGVQIDWSNLTEKDVAGYVIERSSNGTDFSAIGEQLPTSNQDDRADYSAFDATPKAGTNYYRIKAEETTGKIVYSKILSVNLGSTTQSLRLYPNPVTGNQVNISLSNVRSGQYDLRVVSVNGQDVLRQRISSHGSTITQTIDLPATVAPGIYNMVITGADYRETKMFIVQ